MYRPLSVVLILLVSQNVFASAEAPKPDKEICGVKLVNLQDSVKSWVASAEKCPLNKFCDNQSHRTQYNQIPLTCIRWRGLNPAQTSGLATVGKEALPKIETGMAELVAMFAAIKPDLVKLDEEVGRPVRDAWKELDALQSEVLRSTLASGRTERALFYSFLERETNLNPNKRLRPANVEELLRYTWAMPLHTSQRDLYSLIGELAQSSKDSFLQTLHAVNVANVVNPELKNHENLINEQMEKLRDNLSKNSFATLVAIARRFPPHFNYLRERLFKLPDGSKPAANTLPILAHFIDQLPTDEQRLKTADALLQSLTAENGTMLQDPEYVYPLAQLAHAIPNLVDVKAHPDLQQSVEGLMAKFNSPVDGKSLQYYQNLLASPSARSVAA
uniref:TRIO salivary gland protein n=1 Tax=Anopheles epiroticus TaxID=199890 RepID=A0A182P2I8_9DIPT